METTRVDIVRRNYALAIQNFLRSFSPESGKKLVAAVVETTDDICAKHNWFIASEPMMRTGLWKTMREDTEFHVIMMKFERIALGLMSLEGMRDDFITAMNAMLMTEPYATNIVDGDFTKTTDPMHQFTAISVPGLVGLLSVIMFRDLWTFVER